MRLIVTLSHSALAASSHRAAMDIQTLAGHMAGELAAEQGDEGAEIVLSHKRFAWILMLSCALRNSSSQVMRLRAAISW